MGPAAVLPQSQPRPALGTTQLRKQQQPLSSSEGQQAERHRQRSWDWKSLVPSHSATLDLMAFNDLLKQVGGVGRFQKIQVTLVILPLLLMASHNTMQNFTAAIPTHHCRPPADANLSKDGELDAWLPRDRQGLPKSCVRFTSPQEGLPFPNGTEANSTGATEPCTDGWVYDNSTFSSTIVTEVRRLQLPAPCTMSAMPCPLGQTQTPRHAHRLSQTHQRPRWEDGERGSRWGLLWERCSW